MILSEIIEEIYEGLGNPSDLDYKDNLGAIDTTSDGWIKMVRAVNDGCLALATWKLVNGHQIKLRLNEETGFLLTSKTTDTVSGFTAHSLTFTGTPTIGSLVIGRTSGAKGVIGFVSGHVATMLRLDGGFQNETVDIYKRQFIFPNSTITDKIIDIIDVQLTDGTSLTDEPKEVSLVTATSLDVGIPTAWKRISKGIRFDIYPEDDTEFFVRYVRGPSTLVNSTDEPELPIQMHRGLVLYGMWWGLRRMQESSDAYSVKRDLDDFMARVRIEDDFIISGQVKVYPEGYSS